MSRSRCHAADCSLPSWLASSLGSYDGADTIARILPVAGSSATTDPLHGPSQPRCMASHAACCTWGVDRGRHIAAAWVTAGEEVGQAPSEQALVGAVEHGVLGALEPGAGVLQRVEAGDRCVGERVGVHAQEPEPAVGGHRVGQQLAAGRDLAALTGVFVEQHPLVAGGRRGSRRQRTPG